MGKRVVCPKCGGRLYLDELHQISHIRQINYNGTVSKRVRKKYQGPEDFAYVYCGGCGLSITEDQYYLNSHGEVKILTDKIELD